MASGGTASSSSRIVRPGPVKNQPAGQPDDRQIYGKYPQPLDADANASHHQVTYLFLWLTAWSATRPFRLETVSNERVLAAPQHSTLRDCKDLVAKCAGSRFEMANGRTVRQVGSNIDPLCDTKCIFEFDTQVSNSAVDLCVAKQQLDGSEIASLAIDFRCLCATQRMCAIPARL